MTGELREATADDLRRINPDICVVCAGEGDFTDNDDQTWDCTACLGTGSVSAAATASPRALNGSAPADEEPPGELTAKGLRVVLAVRTTQQVLNMPPPAWLVDEWLVVGSLACIYGKPSTLKSLVAQSWAFCLATGHDWYGHTVVPSRVLYVAAEGAGGLGKRITAWCDDFGVPVDDLADLKWLPIALNLLDDEIAAGVVAAAVDNESDVVVIDTVARATPGANENDSAPFSKVVNVADRLRELGKTVILVHHAPQVGGRLRGHTVLEGALDTNIEAERDPGAPTMTLSMPKQKDFAEAQPIALKLRIVGESVVLDRIEGRGTLTKTGHAVLDAIRNSNGTGIGAADLQAGGKWAKTTFYNAVKDLVGMGLIRDTNPHGPALWVAVDESPVP